MHTNIKGITNLTKQTGKERVGVLMLIAMVLGSGLGRTRFHDTFEERRSTFVREIDKGMVTDIQRMIRDNSACHNYLHACEILLCYYGLCKHKGGFWKVRRGYHHTRPTMDELRLAKSIRRMLSWLHGHKPHHQE